MLQQIVFPLNNSHMQKTETQSLRPLQLTHDTGTEESDQTICTT
jgi:hypothetical protein